MKKYFVIGNPIDHSLSPKLHNYWLKENNIDAIYDKKKIEEKNLQTIISEVKEKKINGINVTVPFKKAVIPYLDKLSPEAEQTQPVNTIILSNDNLIGHNTDILGFADDFNEKTDIHVHVPAGAIPKDGPSAGVGMYTAIVSLLSGKSVKDKVAMTGEITLRGNVLPIGGVKEKVTAAHRSGIKTIILPDHNRKDLEDIPEHIKKDLDFHFAKEMMDVIDVAIPGLKGRGKTKKSAPKKSKGA